MTEDERIELLDELERLQAEVSTIHEKLEVQKVLECEEEFSDPEPVKVNRRPPIRKMENFNVWLDYVNRMMYNADLRRLGEVYEVHSSTRKIGEWDGKSGYVYEKRSQDWLWAQLIAIDRRHDTHPEARRGFREK